MQPRLLIGSIAAVLLTLAPNGEAIAQGPTRAASPPPRTIPELERRISDVLARTGTPGIALTLVRHDTVLYAGGLGLADVAAKRPATGKTLFRVGSTSKVFTALAVLMLQEEGKLSLDDPLRSRIPETAFENAWESTDPVRIVNALEHTTGFDDWSLAELASSDPTPLTLRQGLDYRQPGSRVSRWRPGTRVAYSNSGPPLAAYVVERVEGKPFEQIVRDRLFTPIGMRTATYFFPDTTIAPFATLYADSGSRSFPYWHALQRPAGSVNASAEDMAQYLRFFLNRGAVNGKPLLTPASIERLERSESSLAARAGLPVGYGLHMARYVDSGFVWTGHDGGVPGGLTNMAYIPEYGIGFAFMLNRSSTAAFQEIARLVRAYLTANLAPPPLPAAASMPRAQERVAGWYRIDNPRVQRLYAIDRLTGLTRVTVDDSSLTVDPLLGKAQRYLPLTTTTFRGEREPVATLAVVQDSANGRPLAIERVGYMLPTSLVRVPTSVALLEIVVTALWIVGVVVTVVVAIVGSVRLAVRRREGSPVARSWGLSMAAISALAAAIAIVATSLIRNAQDLGRPGAVSIAAYTLFWLFAVLALLGGVAAMRARQPGHGSRPQPVALWVGRSIAVLNLIVAAYLLRWGAIGWRMWS